MIDIRSVLCSGWLNRGFRPPLFAILSGARHDHHEYSVVDGEDKNTWNEEGTQRGENQKFIIEKCTLIGNTRMVSHIGFIDTTRKGRLVSDLFPCSKGMHFGTAFQLPDDRQCNKKWNKPHDHNHNGYTFWIFMSSIFEWFGYGNIARARKDGDGLVEIWKIRKSAFTDQLRWQPEKRKEEPSGLCLCFSSLPTRFNIDAVHAIQSEATQKSHNRSDKSHTRLN